MIQELYDHSGPVSECLMPDYREALSQKGGVQARWASSSVVTEFLQRHPGADAPLTRWIRGSGHYEIVLIPLDDLNGDVHGWVMRSNHNRGFYVDYDTCAFMAGLWNFTDFKFGTPIVIVEGVKDALAVQRFYPYCLSTITAAVTANTLAVLKCMTRRVVVVGDNDKGGRTLIKKFRDNGFEVKSPKLPVKDPGTLFDPGKRKLVEPYLKAIKGFCRK